MARKPSPLYDKPMPGKKKPLPPGAEEWEAQPSGRVKDSDNTAATPDEKGTMPTPEEVEHRLGQFRANVGRDASPRWRSIKTVGVKV